MSTGLHFVSQRWRQGLRWAALGLAFVLFVPVMQVGCVRVFDPPTTGPRVARWLGGRISGRVQPPVSYQKVPLDDVSGAFLLSLWVTEDGTYYNHHGFNWTQIRHAWEESRATGRPPRGASTITQQCARSLFLWQRRSWLRKGLEAYYTFWMERLLSKERILELYVNVIETGNGVYGLEAGARHHYGIPASELDWEQAAMLTAMLPTPRRSDPNAPSPYLQERQTTILSRLASSYGVYADRRYPMVKGKRP